MRRAVQFSGIAAAVSSLLFATPIAASAAEPERVPFEDTFHTTNTDVCGFPIEIAGEVSGFDLLFFNDDGDVTRIEENIVEQDTFSANGNTLVGEPFTAHATIELSPSGDLTRYDVRGVIEKVRLPDGSLFIGAGQFSFLTAGTDVVVVPEHGASKNLDGFCAALAG